MMLVVGVDCDELLCGHIELNSISHNITSIRLIREWSLGSDVLIILYKSKTVKYYSLINDKYYVNSF